MVQSCPKRQRQRQRSASGPFARSNGRIWQALSAFLTRAQLDVKDATIAYARAAVGGADDAQNAPLVKALDGAKVACPRSRTPLVVCRGLKTATPSGGVA